MFHSKGGARCSKTSSGLETISRSRGREREKTGMEAGDLIVLVAGSAQPGRKRADAGAPQSHACRAGDLRVCGIAALALAQKYADRHGIFEKTGDPAKDYRFSGSRTFPMFEWDESEKRWMAAHHPFTSPHEQDMGVEQASSQ